jgi:hypothetical protein
MLSVRRIVWAILIGLLIGIFLLYLNYYKFQFKGMNQIDCQGDIFETVHCLNQEFNSFYVFNYSNAGKRLTYEEFKSQGGVCLHSTIWYQKQLEGLGYETFITPVNLKQNMSHVILIASSKEGYCLIDQNYINCVEFGE